MANKEVGIYLIDKRKFKEKIMKISLLKLLVVLRKNITMLKLKII